MPGDDRYLDLMARVLTDSIYDPVPGRREGRDWPARAHTMVGMVRLDSLRRLCEDAIDRGVPGDFMEAGVWRGGAAIMMKAVLEARGDRDRLVWAADSFAGVPHPKPDAYPRDEGSPYCTYKFLAVPREAVAANFDAYGLLDDRVKFVPGEFCDTLPHAAVGRLAVLRLDGDMYESTIVALESLYDRVSPGGHVIVDDYHWIPACRAAVDDFRLARGVDEEVVTVDWTAIYWTKRS